MRVIKNINNNVSLCLDSTGREVIAFGKGVGFTKPPLSIPLCKVERTFYNIKDVDLEIIKDIPVEIMKASIRIVDDVEQTLNITLMSTTTLSLADHINFAIKRKDAPISLDMALQEDIKQIYQEEMELAYKALTIIYEETNTQLDNKEAGMIALHFINNQISGKDEQQSIGENLVDKIVEIIEREFHLVINRDGFNYSRFVTHIHYLLRRALNNKQIESQNYEILKKNEKDYPISYQCALYIRNLFVERLSIELNDEEVLYVILHINRLCLRDIQEKK